MDKLKAVTEKICELSQYTDLYPITTIKMNSGLSNQDKERIEIKPIREAEVLMSLKRIEENRTEYAIDHNGCFITIDKYCNVECVNSDWILGKTASEQPQEAIEFLYEILNCKSC